MDEKQFIKGFNNGYFLSEHRPELLDTLIKGITSADSHYLEGLKEGQKQKQNELTREKIKSSMQQEKKQEHNKGRER